MEDPFTCYEHEDVKNTLLLDQSRRENSGQIDRTCYVLDNSRRPSNTTNFGKSLKIATNYVIQTALVRCLYELSVCCLKPRTGGVFWEKLA